MNRVLDADVIIGALDGNDPHHAEARQLLTLWRLDHDALSISVINLSEVLVAPAADPVRLAAARQAIRAIGVRSHLPNETISIDAARMRQRHPISLPDAYCLATARHLGATVASFDRTLIRAAVGEGLATV